MPHKSGPSAAEDLIAGARSTFRHGFGGVLSILVESGAPIYIDGRREQCSVSYDTPDAPPICTWRADGETLFRIFRGARAFESAYLSGRLSISGDMSLMARLQMERGSVARRTGDEGR